METALERHLRNEQNKTFVASDYSAQKLIVFQTTKNFGGSNEKKSFSHSSSHFTVLCTSLFSR